ncbi:3-deoxy-7-phosphoheptulonate synthase [Legionella pneumophila]|nr:3-deoxy-7-phosphoheptulonate synthase [Legionella pneumophila]
MIARASVGEYFLIQSGDCAENFYECDKDTTLNLLPINTLRLLRD